MRGCRLVTIVSNSVTHILYSGNLFDSFLYEKCSLSRPWVCEKVTRHLSSPSQITLHAHTHIQRQWSVINCEMFITVYRETLERGNILVKVNQKSSSRCGLFSMSRDWSLNCGRHFTVSLSVSVSLCVCVCVCCNESCWRGCRMQFVKKVRTVK